MKTFKQVRESNLPKAKHKDERADESISEGASVYKSTASKAKSGKIYAFGRDSRLDGRPKEEGGYYVWVLKKNYDGKVRGAIRSSWAYVKKDLSYEDAVKLMNKRLGYVGFDLNESKGNPIPNPINTLQQQ